MAQNARVFGATSRADPESVAQWLAVILDEPGITPADLDSWDPTDRAALALAEADAGLANAQEALLAFEEGRLDWDETDHAFKAIVDLRFMAKEILFELATTPQTKRRRQRAKTLFDKILRQEELYFDEDGKRRRLLTRYVREAQAKRDRAFAKWLGRINRLKPE